MNSAKKWSTFKCAVSALLEGPLAETPAEAVSSSDAAEESEASNAAHGAQDITVLGRNS